MSSAPDMNRIGEALARPGLDTRQWVSLGVIEVLNYDTEQGPIADVRLLPSMELVTARIGAQYAGKGFGIWAPLHIDDEVLLGLPDGDQGIGWVIVARMWSPADTPPSEAVGKLDDLLVRVEKDKNLNIKASGTGTITIDASGGGNVYIKVAGAGQVQLGSDGLLLPLDGLVHGSGIDPFTGVAYALLNNASKVVLGKK